jgi:methylphosphotriester-DNA--protein-cysteine methyltransferase
MAVRFVASRNSKVFHRADCPHAAKISARNRVEYADLRAARASGKRPCRSCHPERATDAADSPDL